MDASVEPSRPTLVPDGLPPERRFWAAAAVFAALAMASLDTAIANIALPAIAADLKTTPADVVWVVNVYQIALVATLLPLGALGEIVGHKRIYLGGLILFTIASVVCACAWSLPSLLVGRVLQGLGAGGIMSVNTALVRFIYPPHQMGRGYGHNALVVATAFTLGPTVASGILSVGSWPWLFAINIPFGILAALIGFKTDAAADAARHARFRFFGSATGCRLHRAVRAGHRQCRARNIANNRGDRGRSVRPDGMGANPQTRGSSRPHAAGRPVFASRCSRCRQAPRSVRSPCRASPSCRCRFISRTCCIAHRSRPDFHHALAAGGRGDGADRRPPVGSPSRRRARRRRPRHARGRHGVVGRSAE